MGKVSQHSTVAPPLGTSEDHRLEFKAQAVADRYELAKDVVALANAQGGTLLVGAVEQQGLLLKYLPMAAEEAPKVGRAYEEAVRDRVRPAPVFHIRQLPVEGGVVVAVNVEPFPGQVIGVRLSKEECKREDVYHFPYRVGTQTRFLTPEQVPMFVDGKLRRVAILLEQAKGARVNVRLSVAVNGGAYSPTATISRVDVMTNTLELSYVDQSSTSVMVPLDFVSSVCEGFNGKWELFVNGSFSTGTRSLHFIPR